MKAMKGQPDKVANTIATGILKVQNQFAKALQGITRTWKQKHQWVFLYSICIVFGTLSMLAIIQPFNTADTGKIIIIKSIIIPKSLYKKNREFLITKKELQAVQEYKAKHHDLLKMKPSLSDSLTLIEESYYSQQK
jgi:hypothetical protein